MMKQKVITILKKSRRDGNIAIDNDNLDRALTLKRIVEPQDSFNTLATESMSSEDDSSVASTAVSTAACCSSTPSSSTDHDDNDHSQQHKQCSNRRSCLRKPDTPRRAVSLLVRGEMELWLPFEDEPITKNTCIVFNETVRVKKIRPVRQLTDNHEALWFSDEEYVAMRQKCKRLAYRVENDMTNGRKYCVRGLESLLMKINGDDSAKHHQRRTSSATRKVGWDAVFDEQESQFHKGEYNDERIAYKYKQTSVYSKRQALYLASLDEQDAQVFLYGRSSSGDTGVKSSSSSVPPPPAATPPTASSDHAIAA
mmetsp:Transcript_53973/g.131054  ORF Transcript_53973/g.131054 Transcript_53973/m.131054 type:complete len:311 (+) Transcript_53973:251-1183(+)